jgi:hypothetical protein
MILTTRYRAALLTIGIDPLGSPIPRRRRTPTSPSLSGTESLPEARELARHSDLRMTLKYTHIGLEDQAKALAALPSPLRQGLAAHWLYFGRPDRPEVTSDGPEGGVVILPLERQSPA